MPFDALSAKARLIVPVGAIESRCELRNAVLADLRFQLRGQAGGEARPREIHVGAEQRKGAAFLRELHGGPIGGVAQWLRKSSPPSRARLRRR